MEEPATEVVEIISDDPVNPNIPQKDTPDKIKLTERYRWFFWGLYFVFVLIVSLYWGGSIGFGVNFSRSSSNSPTEVEEPVVEELIPTIHTPTEPLISFCLELPNETFYNRSADICEDPFEYTCGNFNRGKNDEMLYIVSHENEIKKHHLNRIITKEWPMCYTNQGCINAHNFYQRCINDKTKNVDRTSSLVSGLKRGLERESHIYKIRYLIRNGITNYVHLTKEKLETTVTKFGIQHTWVHYLRPGGVLYPHKSIHTGLYGNEGLVSKSKEVFSVGGWVSRFPLSEKWFGPKAESQDLLYVENVRYFEKLEEYLRSLSNEDFDSELEWYVRNSIEFFDAQSCLDQAKLTFPVSLCRRFYEFDEASSPDSGREVSERVKKQFHSKHFSSLRVGGCSALLHSNTQGEYLGEVENQKFVKDWSLFNVHKVFWRKWYSTYDPVYLYFTYPRVLGFVEDPVDWFAQTNAWYDSFHDEVVLPPGIVQYPLYHEIAADISKFARFGYVVGHEIAHSVLRRNDIEECTLENENRPGDGDDVIMEKTLVRNENMADIIGVSKSFEALYTEGEYWIYLSNEERCNFFLLYPQMYCSATPDAEYDFVHGTPRQRANYPILYGDRNLIDEFNKCFGCELEYYESDCRLHQLSRRFGIA